MCAQNRDTPTLMTVYGMFRFLALTRKLTNPNWGPSEHSLHLGGGAIPAMPQQPVATRAGSASLQDTMTQMWSATG